MTDLKSLWRRNPPSLNDRPERLQQAWNQTLIDAELLQKYAKRAAKRRSVPPWSVPFEVWHLSPITPESPDASEQRAGLGSDRTITDAVSVRQWLHKAFMMIRFWGTAPSAWNCSKGFAIPKSAAPGPNGKRAVHGLDPIGT
eukprot:4220435-Pyramimonas_sp.AAC.1